MNKDERLKKLINHSKCLRLSISHDEKPLNIKAIGKKKKLNSNYQYGKLIKSNDKLNFNMPKRKLRIDDILNSIDNLTAQDMADFFKIHILKK
jgi:hypothetical protein